MLKVRPTYSGFSVRAMFKKYFLKNLSNMWRKRERVRGSRS